MSYTVFLIFNEIMTEYRLPEGDYSEYDIDISSEINEQDKKISFRKINGEWTFVNSETVLMNSGVSQVLYNKCLIRVHVQNSSVSFIVFSLENTGEYASFRKYLTDEKITIGSDRGCSICIPGKSVSGTHAVVTTDRSGSLISGYSENGVYINGVRSDGKTKLNNFDTVCIMGTKIIFLGRIVAVNNPDSVRVSLREVPDDFSVENNTAVHIYSDAVIDKTRQCSVPEVCVIEGCTEKNGRSVFDVSNIPGISFITSALLTCALSFSSEPEPAVLLGCFPAFALLTGTFLYAADRLNGLRLFERRRYVRLKTEQLRKLSGDYKDMIRSQVLTCGELIKAGNGRLCRLQKNDPGFACFSAGTGKADLSDFIELKTDASYCVKLADRFRTTENAPVIFSLLKNKLTVIRGSIRHTSAQAGNIIFQLAGNSSSRDLKIYVLGKEGDSEGFRWMRWLPHTFSDDMKRRYVSLSDDTIKDTLFILTEELRKREEYGFCEDDPYIIVLFASDSLLENHSILKYIFSSADYGVSFIVISQKNEFRKKAGLDISVDVTGESISFRTPHGRNIHTTDSESPDRHECENFARRLIRAGHSDRNFRCIPDCVSLFELLDIGNISDIDIMENYRSSRARDGISAVIGSDSCQNSFFIDIHEKNHGPHGLVAGMTGSGKSEFLQTLVVSLALRYSPQELSFVFIDYKGGGTSDAFEKLPHTAGIITNLSDDISGSTCQSRRVLVSLKSEIRKRQQILKKYQINHADVYSKIRDCDPDAAAMPHLLIIVDEFAELKKEQPEFISQLVSISRIGRSLGIHLILATQKPSGVVDDEIFSNARFRVCLRVQDRSESMEMLRRPEASDISIAGRAYFQTGNNEIFEMIQTGYSGAVTDMTGSGRDNACMINDDGSESVFRVNDQSRSTNSTQLKEAVDQIISLCEKNKVSAAPGLWLPPLPQQLLYGGSFDNVNSDEVRAVFGAVDDPEKQMSYTAGYDLVSGQNLIAAGQSGSGKTNFVKVFLSSLVSQYNPEKFRFFIFDFAGGAYRKFEKLPHCDGFCDEADIRATGRFFEMMTEEIRRRKKIFSHNEISDYSSYCLSRSDLPVILIIFEGYYVFRELFPEKEEDFLSFSRDCARFGIYIIVTVRQITDIRFRIRYNFRNTIAFSLSDRTEYQLAYDRRPDFEIPVLPGRGLLNTGRRFLEFQTYLFEDSMIPACTVCMENDRIINHEEEEKSIPDGTFCIVSEEPERYVPFVLNAARTGCEVCYWSLSGDTDPDDVSVRSYCGLSGAEELLFRLTDIFTVRRDLKKSGYAENFEMVYIYISSLNDFCRCIISDSDLCSAAGTFISGGNGYGVCFVSSYGQCDDMKDSELYRLFISKCIGDNDVKSICL